MLGGATILVPAPGLNPTSLVVPATFLLNPTSALGRPREGAKDELHILNPRRQDLLEATFMEVANQRTENNDSYSVEAKASANNESSNCSFGSLGY